MNQKKAAASGGNKPEAASPEREKRTYNIPENALPGNQSEFPKKYEYSETVAERKSAAALAAAELRDDDELTPDDRPTIHAGSQDIAAVSSDAWRAIRYANRPPRLFVRAGLPVRMTVENELQNLTADRLLYELERAAFWYFMGTGKFRDVRIKAKPPRHIAADMLAHPEIPLPELRRISAAPCFDFAGNLCSAPGYHDSGIFIVGSSMLPPLPTVADAVSMIDELFTDFPFEGPADRANAYAALIVLFVRDMIPGPVPAHLFEASIQGTGKTLLSELLFEIAAGGRFEITAPTNDEDELRKRITALLIGGAAAVLIDNAESIASGTLSSALTSTKWTDRILGRSEISSIPNNAVFLLTGNNVGLSGEIARRIVRIRLTPRESRPWERAGFRFPHILTHVRENRTRYQAAAISLVKAWIDAGRPPRPEVAFGSFESYAEVLGGILHNAGINGFLENRRALFEEADAEGSAWRVIVSEWWLKFGPAEILAAQIFPIADDMDGLELDGKDQRGRKVAFGRKLSKMRDRIFDDLQIRYVGTFRRAVTWKLEKLKTCEDVRKVEDSSTQGEIKINRSWGEISSQKLTSSHTETDELDIF